MQNTYKMQMKKERVLCKINKNAKNLLKNIRIYDNMMINWEEGLFMKIKAIYRGGKSLYFYKI